MRFNIPEDWCIRMAQLEGDAEIGAGLFARDPTFDGELAPGDETEGTNVAFGRFIRLMRRSKNLSVEKLADDADVEVAELLNIEENATYKPSLRTVHQLATFFEVKKGNLMQVARLTVSRDSRLTNESVRFAARSETNASLSQEERQALEAFVAVLSEQK